MANNPETTRVESQTSGMVWPNPCESGRVPCDGVSATWNLWSKASVPIDAFCAFSLTLQAVATGAGKELNGLKLESFDKIESCVWKYGIGGGGGGVTFGVKESVWNDCNQARDEQI